ncbi:Multidrug resistance protein MdtL [Pelagimonas phthalicica]|uniref:Multidrug resistance protein MdtL n=2 Tax=Pelagimonas phthalicica TaxID=1037362 RepID=A0A238JIH2_9RHOB|nr:putative MFS family arabinose efflux permease [Pelagimonas phthalicica]SMX30469.1 Multidrug resistance protein MdtL [Pelagimonas phthalicica]
MSVNSEFYRGDIMAPIVAGVTFALEIVLVPMVLIALREDLQLTEAQLPWVYNAYSIAVALAVLVGGWLGDRLGVRQVFAAGVSLFALGGVIVALSGQFETFLLGRVLQGIGGGLFSPLVPILLTSARSEKPGKILMIWGSIAGYVVALVPLLGAQVIAGLGWKLVFVALAVMALLAFAVSLTVSAGAGAKAPGSRPDLRAFARLLASRSLMQVYTYIFCTYGCITFFLFHLPLALDDAGATAGFAGVVLCALWLSFAMASTMLSNAVDGKWIGPISVAAPICLLLGVALLVHLPSSAGFLAAAIAIGVGFACSNAPSTQLVLKHAPEGLRSLASSLDITLARLGGVALVAALAGRDGAVVLGSVAVLVLLSVLCIWTLTRGRGQTPLREGA